jgi:hypothetical protein
VGDDPARMDREARRVQAERNRRRLPHRGPVARWARRILGLLATAAFLGSGVAIALMVMPEAGQERALGEAPAPSAEPTPEPTPTATPKPKRKPLTKAQRQQRVDAVEELRRQGYTTLKATDYDPRATLRVLIGRPVGDAAGGYRAFFFNKDGFIGNDTTGPSSTLSVAKKGKRTITLSYGVYQSGDPAGQPSRKIRVRFKLEGETLVPDGPIPIENLRFQRRTQ